VHGEAAVLRIEANLQLTALEHPAVVVAEKRNQHFAVQIRPQRPPVDVEERGVRRAFAPGQYVVPPRVVGTDPHVIGDEIEQVSDAARL
jgi:hypothetical protein